ncbi:MAG: stage 0 sporulation family protein [Bacillota bacterium]|jgi:cell fate regulator YaaT (PSP1 superfamily)
MTGQLVGVQFKKTGKTYYFDPGALDLEKGAGVIVETVRGLEYGTVVIGPRPRDGEDGEQLLKPVVRKVTDEDLKCLAELQEKETRAFQIGEDKIKAHGLPMKLVGVDYTFDASKVIFYFTAEGRVDFRELVRDLASVFRTRIELRQIGVRDEAKMLGGLGGCGRELCCASWLREFTPVSIRMAKEQNLSLNPAKISGICGRLMCCLKYESEVYEIARGEYPDVGARVETPAGEGKVTGVNIFRNTVSVELKDSKHVQYFPLKQLKTLPKR